MARRAIVVGSNGPPGDDKLKFAETDAENIEKTLRSECDFEVERLDGDSKAAYILERIGEVAAECTPEDSLLVYFSGHGELLSGKLYLLLAATKANVFASAVNAHHIIEYLQMSAASDKLMILDCCHAGRAAGFKGTEKFPEEIEGGSELILCAGEHLKKTRELPELKGGFMTHNVCDILNSPANSFVKLPDLVEELRLRAKKHNTQHADKSVPLPFLFGTDKANFLLKKPKGPVPVVVRYQGTDALDTDMLFKTIQPYLKWESSVHIPVEVHLPKEIDERIATLSSYLESDEWPCEVADATKEQVRELVFKIVPRVQTYLAHAIKGAITQGSLDDRSDLSGPAKQALEIYVRAKVIALKRVMSAFWLNSEPDVPWRQTIRTWDTVWSTEVIYGLTPVMAARHQWSFWTDADWRIDGDNVRIFVPQLLGTGESEIRGFGKDIFYEAIVPQLLDKQDPQNSVFLYVAFKRDYQELLREISVRGETFIQTESHNFSDGRSEVQARCSRIAAEMIAEQFDRLPETERPEFVHNVLFSNRFLKDLGARVRKLRPKMKNYLRMKKN